MNIDLTVWKECGHERRVGWKGCWPPGLHDGDCDHRSCSCAGKLIACPGRIPDEEATRAVKDVLEAAKDPNMETLYTQLIDGKFYEDYDASGQLLGSLRRLRTALSRLNEGRSEG